MKQEKQGESGGKKGMGHWLGAPVRALSRACDSYVRKMTACAGAMPTQYAGAGGRGGYGGGRMQQAATFSSRSTRRGPNGADEDVSDLVRAMSQRQQQREQRDVPAATVQARSRSVAVGRIDEDAPYEFGADSGNLGLPPAAVRRSRSAAVGGGVGAGLPPRVGSGGGFGASAVTRKAAGGGGFGASAVTRKAAGGVVHGG